MRVSAAAPGRPPPPPPLLLVVVVVAGAVLLLAGTTQGCVITAWSHGKLNESALLDGGFTPAQPEYIRGSCHCCALCYHEPNCASLSYNSETGQCELYSTVANYSTLQPDPKEEWTYHVRTGRSRRGQFCRRDEDCEGGDACRGRFCTDLQLVTCRTICEQFGCIGHYDDGEPEVYGWINDTTVKLLCWMPEEDGGYTQIFRNTRDAPSYWFEESTILEYNTQLDADHREQSLLKLAETLRLSGDDDTYRILIRAKACNGEHEWTEFLEYESPSTEEVLADVPRTNGFNITAEHEAIAKWQEKPTMLWKRTSGRYRLIISDVHWKGSLANPFHLWMDCFAEEVVIYINK